MSATVEDCIDFIDAATAPHVMNAFKALAFLEELRDQIDGRIDALRDESAEASR